MGWKNLSYWFKGGVVGFAIVIILSILIAFLGVIYPSPSGVYNCDLGVVGYKPCDGGAFFIQGIKFYLFILIIPFLFVSIFIGWLIGRIKNTKLKAK
jgi:hypothetical protein